jgi:hypothetical protein
VTITLFALSGSVSIQVTNRPAVALRIGSGALVRSVHVEPPSVLFQIFPIDVPT